MVFLYKSSLLFGMYQNKGFLYSNDYIPIMNRVIKLLMFSDIFVSTGFGLIEPILAKELIAVIENQFEDSTPGFKNSASKILKKLYKFID